MDPLDLVRTVRHGTVCLKGREAVVYVDPYRLREEAHDADVIVITHDHPDHFDPKSLARAARADTCYLTTPALAGALAAAGVPEEYITAVTYESPAVCLECGVSVTPLPAENENHPIEKGFGCLVELDGLRYYCSGDTDVLADIACDVLFVCCDGIYNMRNYTRQIPEALHAMEHRPGLTVPYHCGEPGMESCGARLCAALVAAGLPCREWKA